MPFDEKAKEELRRLFAEDPLKGISLTNLKTGEVTMAVIATSIWDATIRKYLKNGNIPTKAYDANEELIAKWETLKENVEDCENEIKELKDTVKDQSQMLAKIETDPFYARVYVNSKSGFAERRDKAVSELAVAQRNFEENRRELPVLTKQVSNLRRFELLREKGYV